MARAEDRPAVLMVGPTPPPIGGIATQVQLLLSSSLSQAFDLDHFDPDVPLVRSGARPPRGRRLIASLRMLLRFVHALRSRSARIAHLHASSFPGFYEKALMAVIARFMGRRAILHLHSGAFEETWRRSRAKWLISSCLRVPDSVVVLSDGWSQVVHQIAPRARVDVVPTSVLAARYYPPLPKQETVIHILFVGWMIRHKGVFDLVEAVSQMGSDLPPFRVHLVGDGVDREAVEEAVAARGLTERVEIEGWQTEEAKVQFFRTADLFVLPTHSEGLPVVLLEAMSAGLPVITTPVGAIPEVIRPGVHGELVEPSDPEGLAAALTKLCRDPELRARYGAACLQRVRGEYDIERGAERVAAIYRRLLKDA